MSAGEEKAAGLGEIPTIPEMEVDTEPIGTPTPTPTPASPLRLKPSPGTDAEDEDSTLGAPHSNASSTKVVAEEPKKRRRSSAHRRRASTTPRQPMEARRRSASSFIAPHFFPAPNEMEAEMLDERERAHLAPEHSGSSASSLEAGEPEKVELPPLTRRQLLTICMLALANFASTVVFSCIAPFFPSEAKKKGASATVIGFIFSSFELVMFFAAPFYGRYMDKIGPKLCYCAGLFVTAITIIMFGFTTQLPDGAWFITICFVIRIIESIGDAAFMTASFSITAKEFPGRVGTIIGVLETFSGFGFTAGPAIGGVLYQYGGFKLPFIVLGVLLFSAGVLAIFVIPKQPKDAPQEAGSKSGMMGLIRIPSVVLMCSAITICALNLTFLDPTLEEHLSVFNLSPMLIGLMFLLTGGVYTLTAPAWGYVTDRIKYVREIMIFGAAVSTISMFLIGPSPLLGLEKSLPLVAVAQVLLGLGVAALFIPTFKDTLECAKVAGYPDSFETYGTVSGLFQAFFSFGGFLGPTVGGLGAQSIGFEWTATILAGLCLFIGVAITAFQINNRCCGGDERNAARLARGDEKTPLLGKRDKASDSGLGTHGSMDT